MKKVILILSIMMVLGGFGCAALSHYITPAEVDRDAIGYIVGNGDGRAEDYKAWPYPNLAMANKLKEGLDDSHEQMQHWYRQNAETDKLNYSQHADTVSTDITVGYQREEAWFGEKGLLSMGLTMAGFGSFTGVLGLMRKRPGDVTAGEVEQVVADATGQTAAQLEAKNKQLFQVVKGVQAFIDANKDSAWNKSFNAVEILKARMNECQDTDTQLAVKAAKVGA